jgi:hypothetical protein
MYNDLCKYATKIKHDKFACYILPAHIDHKYLNITGVDP